MLSRIGSTELLVILVVALLIVGPNMLPKMGKSIGKSIASFKKGLKDEMDETDGSAGIASKTEKD